MAVMNGFLIIIITVTSFINSVDSVSICKFYLIWLQLVKQIGELGKIVRRLSSPYTMYTDRELG